MAQINKPSDYFNTILWSGNSSTNALTGVGFQPDWVWVKERSSISNHQTYDSVRGTTKQLEPNTTGAEGTISTGVTSFDTDGFTVGNNSDLNSSGETYVGWNWLASNTTASNTDGSITSTVSANTTSGFSIVSYTGTGSAATVGHGLGAAPKVTIFKRRNNTASWRVMTTIIDGTHDILYLNATDSKTNASESAPTSSILNLGTGNEVNGSSDTYIAYCFAEKKGYSKFGSYTGNGTSGNGAFIYCGFKPAFVIYKNASATYHWGMYDNKREPFNVCEDLLFPNLNNAESTGDGRKIDMLSNGFKVRATGDINDINGSGNTIIYMAFAEQPLVGTNNIPATAR